MPKLCGTDSFYGGGMVTGQPIGTMIGSRMINNAQAGFIIGAVIMGLGLRTFSWRPNGKIFVCSVLRNESVRWSCISPRR